MLLLATAMLLLWCVVGRAEDTLAVATAERIIPEHINGDVRTQDSTSTAEQASTDTGETVPLPPSSGAVDSKIEYKSADSLVMLGNGTAFLHGSGDMTYKTINLTAGDSVTLSSFAKNTKYNLNLVFSIDEIKYSPDIVDWEATASSEYEVPQDAN